MFTVNKIRESFLSFFETKGHEIVPSSPLIPHHDPTLLFTNAGMVPFKNVFTGLETRQNLRATSSQKCVRAGGKHNDLDNVGYTARHHTFFEMLGNFSFGDYFKQDAIAFAWDFLTNTVNIPKEKLYITVYHTDDEAFSIWQKLTGFNEDRILRIPTTDNFWSMGDTGPCGPCSEIFYDHGDKIFGGLPGTKDADGDRYVEIWNLVFMQYEQHHDGTRINLPKPSIDTGMGLERIAAVLQGVHDNYDIDLFKQIIDTSIALTQNNNPKDRASHRVIADHLRSICFLIADGVLPSNEGRGYVLRRIMRRAMRHVHHLNYQGLLMYQLVPSLIDQMGTAYPELLRASSIIKETLRQEEEGFKDLLHRGLKLLGAETDTLSRGATLPGATAFKLYDTYGFPLDLTKDILRERDIHVDEHGFDHAMQEQRDRARKAWKGSGEKAQSTLWFDLHQQLGNTEFLGYDCDDAHATVRAIIKDGDLTKTANASDEVIILLDQTPCYAESGGQMGDQGTITTNHAKVRILDTTKETGELFLHHCRIETGSLTQGDLVHVHIDEERRRGLRSNHSATHLLHAVLRTVLGNHVTQKGSLVAKDRLRFDFTHNKALSSDETKTIEERINTLIQHNTDVTTKVMGPQAAMERGALALFGEKYGDAVRVVSMGKANAQDDAFSLELCGGTHVHRTGDIGCFVIISEAAIASGVRRIEALTGSDALAYLTKRNQLLLQACAVFKTTPEDFLTRLDALVEEKKKLEKALSEARKLGAMGGSDTHVSVLDINGVKLLAKMLDIPPKELRDIATDLKQQLPSGIIVLTSSFENKASLIVSVSNDLTERYSAVDLVKIGTEAMGGKGGGGRPDFAQSGAPNASLIEAAIEAIKKAI